MRRAADVRRLHATPDVKPYDAEKPRISLDERNPANAATAARSRAMDFDEADEIDDDELNEILWLALKGTAPPAPVRSFFAGRPTACRTPIWSSSGTCTSPSTRTWSPANTSCRGRACTR